MSNSINDLSSEELFRMAEQRRIEEQAQRQEATKQQVADLRAKIRQLDSQYKKDRAALESEISELTGKSTASKGAGRTPGISAKIVEIIKAEGEISTRDINQKLKDAGIKAKNLSQSMAYLKKRGEVTSVGHGVYRAG
ncbi:MAG: hypothetical protein HQL47_08955 [Gammaproteobacteria bacterium]|nr:hypothetical protein [Gammaproteobacteria bacterium]